MKKRTGRYFVRHVVQIFFFMLIALIAVNKTLAERGAGVPFLSDASLHAICPFGGVVTLYNLVTLGTLIQKIHISAVILLVIILLLSVLFGPVFCGWVCPLGTYQEWIGKIGHKILKKKYNHILNHRLDSVLRMLRYLILLWVVYITARSGYLIFEKVDPYNALFSFWSEEVSVTALIILGVITVLSLLVERPWCKYACPYGALLGLSNKIRIFRIHRSSETCIGCQQCDRSCPMNITVSEKENVRNLSCISCLDCISERSCPVTDTVNLEVSVKKKSRKLKSKWLGVLIILFIFGIISITAVSGLWKTESDKIPVRFTSGEYTGAYNPADIRGSYTFEEISELFDIDLQVLYKAFGVAPGTKGTDIKSKDMEGLYEDSGYEVGNESVQIFVALYKDLPIMLSESYIPQEAAELIKQANQELTEDELNYLDSFTMEEETEGIIDQKKTEAFENSENSGNSDNVESENIINGSATFQKALDAGITADDIEQVIQDSMPPTNQTIKDYCIEQGLPFSEIKNKLNSLIQ